MIRFHRAVYAALIAATAFTTFAVPAQDRGHRALVGIYRIAPGKQLDFLKWMAARDAVDREVGVPATQWYAHLDGDSWDYLGIGPDMDDATSDKVAAAARKHGLKTGMGSGLELRTMMASHTDTFAAGPYSAAELVDRVSRP
jgi:hypothetical protein